MSHCGKGDSGETISIMWIFSRSIQEGESCSAATQHILTQELHGSNPAKHLLVNKVLLEHSHVHLFTSGSKAAFKLQQQS